jgi:hypothetical protein
MLLADRPETLQIRTLSALPFAQPPTESMLLRRQHRAVAGLSLSLIRSNVCFANSGQSQIRCYGCLLFTPIVLQKSKIERLRKSRESRCLDISIAAMLARADAKVRGRFCAKRCGPSRRRVRNASAAPKNFVRQPEKTFSTQSTPEADIAHRRSHVSFVPPGRHRSRMAAQSVGIVN